MSRAAQPAGGSEKELQRRFFQVKSKLEALYKKRLQQLQTELDALQNDAQILVALSREACRLSRGVCHALALALAVVCEC